MSCRWCPVARTEGQRQSRAHEERLAKKTGGRRVSASGAFWHAKGDVKTPTLLIEHKWTGKKQITIKSEYLEKISREAILDGRIPVVGFHLNGRNYAIFEEDDALDMLGMGD